MASTNEIAAMVQGGKADVLELWYAVRRFAIKQGLRWFRASDGEGGVTIDDLEQSAFLALLDALKDWKASSGSFHQLVCFAAQNSVWKCYGPSYAAG